MTSKIISITVQCGKCQASQMISFCKEVDIIPYLRQDTKQPAADLQFECKFCGWSEDIEIT